MTNDPGPEVLYPDVVAAGSLAAAVRAAAAEHGLTVAVAVVGSDPLRRAVVASLVPHRAPLEISASPVHRHVAISGSGLFRDFLLIHGHTTDLGEVGRAADAWHVGVPVRDIAGQAPFVAWTGRFEVADPDPERLAEAEWSALRHRAAGTDWPEFRALVEAAYATPELRRLYPFTSHWCLRFSTTTRPLRSVVPVCLHAQSGDYIVAENYLARIVGRATTADEAVAMAVRELPPDLGPLGSA